MKSAYLQKTMKYINLFLLAILAVIITAGTALAHKVNGSVTIQQSIPVGTFHYSGGVALSYAKIKIWAPESDKIEFQNGRTDKNGRFSFVPDQEGIWRVEVADGMGHAGFAEFKALSGVKTTLSKEKRETNLLPYQILLGGSLLLNLAFIIQRIKPLVK